MKYRSVRQHPAPLIVGVAEVIEGMESRYPEQVIALRVLDIVTDPKLGDDRYVRLGDIKAHLSTFGSANV